MSFTYDSLSLVRLSPLNRVSGGSGRVDAPSVRRGALEPIARTTEPGHDKPVLSPSAACHWAEGKHNLSHSLRAQPVRGAEAEGELAAIG